MLNEGDYNWFSDLYSVCLKTNNHLNLKLRIVSGLTSSLKIGILKVQEFGIFELKSMHTAKIRGSYMSAHVLLNKLNLLRKRDKMLGKPRILSLSQRV